MILLLSIIVTGLSILCRAIVVFGIQSSQRKSQSINKISESNLFVSLIICARNEYENIQKNISSWIAALEPNDELIIVNDRSEDKSPELLEQYAKLYDNLKIVHIAESNPEFAPKKFALALGIQSSKHPFLMFTDADCSVSTSWIFETKKAFESGADLITGFGAYNPTKGLLNKLVRFETYETALQTFGFGGLGIPYMAVGRNLAYRKSLFERSDAFESHKHILSGDDDLFIQSIKSKAKIYWLLQESHHTFSQTPANWKKWWNQKIRHLGAGIKYSPIVLFLLGIYGGLNAASSICVPFLAIVTEDFSFLLLWLIRGFFLMVLFKKPMKSFRVHDLWVLLPAFEILYYLYLSIATLATVFRPVKVWN